MAEQQKLYAYVNRLVYAERQRFAAGLRKLNVVVCKVQGRRDESDEFIRLADAIAGFVRDALEGDQRMGVLCVGGISLKPRHIGNLHTSTGMPAAAFTRMDGKRQRLQTGRTRPWQRL